jgi:DNA replication and repair protein RecF
LIIKSIQLQNFRNYKDLHLKADEKFNIIYGNNGHGKTNILESIFICGTGRSHRTSREKELIQFGRENFHIKLELEKKNINGTIEYRFFQGKKYIKVNDIPLDRLNKLMGNLVVVLFSPEDIILLKEDPSGRRRFLDIAISQIKPSYFYHLQEYKKIIANRNALLKDIKLKNISKETLFIWDESLSTIGSKIMMERSKFLKQLEKIIKPKHSFLTGNQEEIEIKYKCSVKNFQEESLEVLKEAYLEMIKKKSEEDIYKTYTSIGPHREDFEITINGISVKNFGSQGQQRTTMLSLKLAEIEFIHDSIGEYPVLLLDDFASELDKERHVKFMNSLESLQVFITSTNREILKDILDIQGKYIHVVKGTCF